MKFYFDMSWSAAFKYDTPFWVGDILKNLAWPWSPPRCTARSPTCCTARPQGHEQETVAAS